MELEVPEGIDPEISGKGHVIEIAPSVQHRPGISVTVKGRRNALIVEPGADLQQSQILIKGTRCRIKIEEGCRLKNCTIIVSGEGSRVRIGRGTTWESGVIFADHGNSVVLGEDCMLSSDVVIRTSDGHGIFDRADGRHINVAKSVQIGRHVWLGNHSRVNKGTTIGDGAVLGQLSVASGMLKPATVYAGVPARAVRSNIVWARTYNLGDAPTDLAVSVPESVRPRWKRLAGRLLGRR